MERQALISCLRHVLADFPQISLAYLFGSQVSGNTGPMSDVDLAVLHDAPANDLQLQAELAHVLCRELQTGQVDVVLLRHAPIELARHIIAQGSVVYQRNLVTRVEYEAYVMGRYGDYLPVLHSQRQQILQGGQGDRRTQRYRETFRRTERTLGAIKASAEQKPR